jgi:iron complex transport system substrate-binding protein
MSRFAPVILFTTMLALLVACSGAPAPAPTATTVVPRSFSDRGGRQITLNAPPTRIVSLAPSITETLFAIGAGSQVVGVTTFCNFPAEAAALTKVGGFTADTLSLEAIIDLDPDLVLAGDAGQLAPLEALKPLGIPVLLFAPGQLQEVYADIEQLGAITGHESEAATALAAMRGRIERIVKVAADIPADQRLRVFWEVFDEPLMTAGPTTFIGQLIELAGAQNIFADASEEYPQVSTEAIIERNPDVIVGPDYHADKLTPELIARRPGWDQLAAVKDERVYLLNADIVSRPGPRLADALEELARILYPERFS